MDRSKGVRTQQELEEILSSANGNLGAVSRNWIQSKLRSSAYVKNGEFVSAGVVSDAGTAANNRLVVEAVLENVMPQSASLAKTISSRVKSLITSNPEACPAALDHLSQLRIHLAKNFSI